MKSPRTSHAYRPAVLGSLLIATVTSLSAWLVWADDKPATQPAAAADKSPLTVAGDKFEAALKTYNLLYQRTDTPGQNSFFTIGIQDERGSSIVHFRIVDCGWKYSDGTQSMSVHAWAQAIQQSKLPLAVAQKLADFNNSTTLTWVTADQSSVFSCAGFFWDRTPDPYTIYAYVLNVHWTAMDVKNALDPVLKAAASEK